MKLHNNSAIRLLLFLALSLFILVGISSNAQANTASQYAQGLMDLQHVWAKIKYQLPEKKREKALIKLASNAESYAKNNPKDAKALIWQGIILATLAGEGSMFDAMDRVKKARDLLLKAEKINSKALDGAIYSSLGSLYYQVPGWPAGFGDDEQAEVYLKKAMKISPKGIVSNFFMADFLLEQKRYGEAVFYFKQALKAPARPNRPLADKGLKAEATQKLAIAKKRAH
ncbi:MAG: hypothetical protein R8K21_07760 [Mariprofundales bacterium]